MLHILSGCQQPPPDPGRNTNGGYRLDSAVKKVPVKPATGPTQPRPQTTLPPIREDVPYEETAEFKQMMWDYTHRRNGIEAWVEGIILTFAGANAAKSAGSKPSANKPPASGPAVVPAIATQISYQRQGRHIKDAREYREGSYFTSRDDAQAVLDAYHLGAAEVLGPRADGIMVRVPGKGFNHNPGSGYLDQPTDIYYIKGTKSVSVVPWDPTWTP